MGFATMDGMVAPRRRGRARAGPGRSPAGDRCRVAVTYRKATPGIPRARTAARRDTVVRTEPERTTMSDEAVSAMPGCSHLGSVQVTELPESTDGCAECLKMGGAWLHLRICL